jgi:hypothetical protein
MVMMTAITPSLKASSRAASRLPSPGWLLMKSPVPGQRSGRFSCGLNGVPACGHQMRCDGAPDVAGFDDGGPH